ncbi:hypothetical protein M433DRAFT_1785 [Acidomyces richmondensis BFW]|nr:MAG: hypothetical protein FE78DRAFT_28851 [Acidomyces sp. 'richmondensis']KYG48655.1 hypothetical protein M433DRAFT_1785 [Acidomyces richmondensis BFW]
MPPMPPALGFIAARFISSSSNRQPDITALGISSLELDKRSTNQPLIHERDGFSSALSPLEASKILTARSGKSTFIPGQGSKPAASFNNQFFLALFAIIGAVMVLASLWFFFWAKNGGFHFREGDWDEYKSTVLRRKGPDGKTLTNATKSTKLGGGSSIAGTQHYKWAQQAARSVIGRDEKGRKGILGKRGWAGTHSVTYSDDYMTESFATQTVSDMTEVRTEPDFTQHSKRYRDRDVQEYKKERPARVGGMNRVADGSHFGTTLAGSETMSESSEQPILDRDRNKEKERAERKARQEAAKMERRWKREAEEAAAALARESSRPPPPPPAHTSAPKKSVTPSQPSASKQRTASRSNSPKKRDFSYTPGPDPEVLSTTYTSTSGQRSASYYDAYRPRASEEPERGKRSRQGSPRKSGGNGGRKDGGYRRGVDSDLD